MQHTVESLMECNHPKRPHMKQIWHVTCHVNAECLSGVWYTTLAARRSLLGMSWMPGVVPSCPTHARWGRDLASQSSMRAQFRSCCVALGTWGRVRRKTYQRNTTIQPDSTNLLADKRQGGPNDHSVPVIMSAARRHWWEPSVNNILHHRWTTDISRPNHCSTSVRHARTHTEPTALVVLSGDFGKIFGLMSADWYRQVLFKAVTLVYTAHYKMAMQRALPQGKPGKSKKFDVKEKSQGNVRENGKILSRKQGKFREFQNEISLDTLQCCDFTRSDTRTIRCCLVPCLVDYQIGFLGGPVYIHHYSNINCAGLCISPYHLPIGPDYTGHAYCTLQRLSLAGRLPVKSRLVCLCTNQSAATDLRNTSSYVIDGSVACLLRWAPATCDWMAKRPHITLLPGGLYRDEGCKSCRYLRPDWFSTASLAAENPRVYLYSECIPQHTINMCKVKSELRSRETTRVSRGTEQRRNARVGGRAPRKPADQRHCRVLTLPELYTVLARCRTRVDKSLTWWITSLVDTILHPQLLPITLKGGSSPANLDLRNFRRNLHYIFNILFWASTRHRALLCRCSRTCIARLLLSRDFQPRHLEKFMARHYKHHRRWKLSGWSAVIGQSLSPQERLLDIFRSRRDKEIVGPVMTTDSEGQVTSFLINYFSFTGTPGTCYFTAPQQQNEPCSVIWRRYTTLVRAHYGCVIEAEEESAHPWAEANERHERRACLGGAAGAKRRPRTVLTTNSRSAGHTLTSVFQLDISQSLHDTQTLAGLSTADIRRRTSRMAVNYTLSAIHPMTQQELSTALVQYFNCRLETASETESISAVLISNCFVSTTAVHQMYYETSRYSADIHLPIILLLASHHDKPGSIPGQFNQYFRKWESCRWPEGFLGDLQFPPPLHSGAAPFSPQFTLMSSQDLPVKNLSTQLTAMHTCPPGSQEFGWTKGLDVSLDIGSNTRTFSSLAGFPALPSVHAADTLVCHRLVSSAIARPTRCRHTLYHTLLDSRTPARWLPLKTADPPSTLVFIQDNSQLDRQTAGAKDYQKITAHHLKLPTPQAGVCVCVCVWGGGDAGQVGCQSFPLAVGRRSSERVCPRGEEGRVEPMRVKRGKYEAKPECKGEGKREIPEKTLRPAASSGTILTTKDGRPPAVSTQSPEEPTNCRVVNPPPPQLMTSPRVMLTAVKTTGCRGRSPPPPPPSIFVISKSEVLTPSLLEQVIRAILSYELQQVWCACAMQVGECLAVSTRIREMFLSLSNNASHARSAIAAGIRASMAPVMAFPASVLFFVAGSIPAFVPGQSHRSFRTGQVAAYVAQVYLFRRLVYRLVHQGLYKNQVRLQVSCNIGFNEEVHDDMYYGSDAVKLPQNKRLRSIIHDATWGLFLGDHSLHTAMQWTFTSLQPELFVKRLRHLQTLIHVFLKHLRLSYAMSQGGSGWARTIVLYHYRPMRYPLHYDNVTVSLNIRVLHYCFFRPSYHLAVETMLKRCTRRKLKTAVYNRPQPPETSPDLMSCPDVMEPSSGRWHQHTDYKHARA
ncbi:hypothetical protein PR048_024161 [Dryococelus australis]|uniref:Uncharacterized protein n=1 Tax=Dryococelus australis TaxID=614101 RepID=A0ABQ9GW45_9NEOP|nr:hypothetical protein PR048_024161 [Dryococelus australis]